MLDVEVELTVNAVVSEQVDVLVDRLLLPLYHVDRVLTVEMFGRSP